jgi:hypothetical protein
MLRRSRTGSVRLERADELSDGFDGRASVHPVTCVRVVLVSAAVVGR